MIPILSALIVGYAVLVLAARFDRGIYGEQVTWGEAFEFPALLCVLTYRVFFPKRKGDPN